MKTILAAIGLLTLFVLGSCGMAVVGIANSDDPSRSQRAATEYAIRKAAEHATVASIENAIRSTTNNYFDNVQKLEAERRYRCWQEGGRNCTRNSRW